MSEQYREYEYNWEGTKLEGMPTVYIEARFDCVDEGENGDGSKYADWELTEFDCSFEGFGEDSCLDDMKTLNIFKVLNLSDTLKVTGITIHHFIKKYCYAQWEKEQ